MDQSDSVSVFSEETWKQTSEEQVSLLFFIILSFLSDNPHFLLLSLLLPFSSLLLLSASPSPPPLLSAAPCESWQAQHRDGRKVNVTAVMGTVMMSPAGKGQRGVTVIVTPSCCFIKYQPIRIANWSFTHSAGCGSGNGGS